MQYTHPAHPHPLQQKFTGDWICDLCKKTWNTDKESAPSARMNCPQNGPDGKPCDFDLCDCCMIEKVPRAKLYGKESVQFSCDECGRDRLTHWFSCIACRPESYDLCDNCFPSKVEVHVAKGRKLPKKKSQAKTTVTIEELETGKPGADEGDHTKFVEYWSYENYIADSYFASHPRPPPRIVPTAPLPPFNGEEFEAKVNETVVGLKKILAQEKNPQIASSVPHAYEDKFLLAAFVTSALLASEITALSNLGLRKETLTKAHEWAKTRPVTLEFKITENCKFLREEEREESVSTSIIQKIKSKFVEKIKSYVWNFRYKYDLIARSGADELSLLTGSGHVELRTPEKEYPRPPVVIRDPLVLNLTWFLQRRTDEGSLEFNINRDTDACRTPRRNPDIDRAIAELSNLFNFCGAIQEWFEDEILALRRDHGLDLAALKTDDLFNPVLPLMEAVEGKIDWDSPEVRMAFLSEQRRSLKAKTEVLKKVFVSKVPGFEEFFSPNEASLFVTVQHVRDLCVAYGHSMEFIEGMLYKQLNDAIGRALTAEDFHSYMNFHYSRLFKPEYAPRLFSYAIRRPGHSPEGVISVEAKKSEGLPEPILTTCSFTDNALPFKIALSATTSVTLLGDRYLHAFVQNQFASDVGVSLSLTARTRQFSSYILVLGRLLNNRELQPKAAILLQNKDEILLSVLTETIPTPKEFKERISSISPEQQRFAKAYRSMQLEGTVFALAAIQVKPALEAVLKLPPSALTKEIMLTQQLLDLFVQYQISPDLLSWDGQPDASRDVKLARVRENAAAISDMIDSAKKEELVRARQEQQVRQPLSPPVPARPPVPVKAAGRGGGGFLALTVHPDEDEGGSSSAGSESGSWYGSAGAAVSGGEAAEPAAAAPSEAAPAETPKPPSDPSLQFEVPLPTGGNMHDKYVSVPTALNKAYKRLDVDNAVRPTIVKTAETWVKTFKPGLLASETTVTQTAPQLVEERNKAFDLLDCLSRSGVLALEQASVHVIVAATHCFAKTLIDVVVQDNVNPIEKVERTSLIVASTIHSLPAEELVKPDQLDRVRQYSPGLFRDRPAPDEH